MTRQTIYLMLCLLGLASCNSDKKGDTKTTASPSVQTKAGDDPIVIGEQSEADTLKGSLKAVANGSIGAATIVVNYYSPAVRGRVIWGGLVPFNNVWVTGAHRATNIEVSGRVKIGGAVIEAGKYALFTIPGKDEWIIIINKNWEQHLADNYSDKDDIIRVKVRPEVETVNQERLRYVIEAESATRGKIAIYWEQLEVSLPIESVK
jgi:hypothetical protein